MLNQVKKDEVVSKKIKNHNQKVYHVIDKKKT